VGGGIDAQRFCDWRSSALAPYLGREHMALNGTDRHALSETA